jgi:hypothetical protein
MKNKKKIEVDAERLEELLKAETELKEIKGAKDETDKPNVSRAVVESEEKGLDELV